MSSDYQAAELEALATLKLLRDKLDLSEISADDREALREWWAEVHAKDDRLEPKTMAFGSFNVATMLYDPNQEGLEPRLIPTALAFRAFDTAIHQGLPGAEHQAEEFLRDCGFDDGSARQIVLQMVAKAPMPDPDAAN